MTKLRTWDVRPQDILAVAVVFVSEAIVESAAQANCYLPALGLEHSVQQLALVAAGGNAVVPSTQFAEIVARSPR